MKRTERRSRVEVMVDILRVIKTGEKMQTHIMYKSNTSYAVLDSNLSFMEKAGLIYCNWRPGYLVMHREDIVLTPRGFELLRNLDLCLKMLGHGEVVGWLTA